MQTAINYNNNIIIKGANRYQKVVGQNGAGKGISGLFLLWTGAFCFEFSGQGRKSGSAYELVDLVTLAPLHMAYYHQPKTNILLLQENF